MKRKFVSAAVALLITGASIVALHPGNALADNVKDLLDSVPGATPTPAPTPQGSQRTSSPSNKVVSIWHSTDMPGQTGPTFPPPPNQVPQIAQLFELPEPLIPHFVPQQRSDCPTPNLECVPPPSKDNPA